MARKTACPARKPWVNVHAAGAGCIGKIAYDDMVLVMEYGYAVTLCNRSSSMCSLLEMM